MLQYPIEEAEEEYGVKKGVNDFYISLSSKERNKLYNNAGIMN